MKKVKIILWLLLAVVVLWAAGYFVFGYVRLGDDQLPRDYFAGKVYETENGGMVLRFIGADGAQLLSPNGQTELAVADYEGGIFRMTGAAAEHYFLVVDAGSLYSNTLRNYFYLVGGGHVET